VEKRNTIKSPPLPRLEQVTKSRLSFSRRIHRIHFSKDCPSNGGHQIGWTKEDSSFTFEREEVISTNTAYCLISYEDTRQRNMILIVGSYMES
jgi:hypothetical protein